MEFIIAARVTFAATHFFHSSLYLRPKALQNITGCAALAKIYLAESLRIVVRQELKLLTFHRLAAIFGTVLDLH